MQHAQNTVEEMARVGTEDRAAAAAAAREAEKEVESRGQRAERESRERAIVIERRTKGFRSGYESSQWWKRFLWAMIALFD